MKHTILCLATLCLASHVVRAGDEPQPKATLPRLAVGDLLPTFDSVDDAGETWKSADHAGDKVLVLYFYPGDFTPGCGKQAEAYRGGLAKLQDVGAEVVGISGDEVSTHKLFKEAYGLKHTLLADPKGELAAMVGLPVSPGQRLIPTGPDKKPILDEDGKRFRVERPLTIERWTLVVGRDGRIASIRKVANPVTDIEDVQKIVEELHK
ncbi:MAG TPA: peroxiredoxin [Planctomycetaceae bacterium]|nr:peroxiredoxin [Planctomycetaceae bacterium]